jgi:hypothetical protein
MKHALIAVLLTAASLRAAEPEKPFPNFYQLDKPQAAATARRLAEADFTAGRYRILIFGLRASVEDKRFAKYGVEMKPIAGCIVSDGILEGARVFNEIMREKLKGKLGRDIFEETQKPKTEPAK